jgi:uncharacterized membrane protein
LLILDVHVPDVQTGLLQALLSQWPTYLGYVTSFLVIIIFWANHHNMFRNIYQVDYALLLINAFFLMCIAFIPFATALLTKYITSPTNQHTAAIVYGATLLLNGMLFNAIWWYAVWKRRLVRRDLDAPAVQRITRGYLFGLLPFSDSQVSKHLRAVSCSCFIADCQRTGTFGSALPFRSHTGSTGI